MATAAAAHPSGRSGPLSERGFFFKDLIGVGPAVLSEQFMELAAFVAALNGAR